MFILQLILVFRFLVSKSGNKGTATPQVDPRLTKGDSAHKSRETSQPKSDEFREKVNNADRSISSQPKASESREKVNNADRSISSQSKSGESLEKVNNADQSISSQPKASEFREKVNSADRSISSRAKEQTHLSTRGMMMMIMTEMSIALMSFHTQMSTHRNVPWGKQPQSRDVG